MFARRASPTLAVGLTARGERFVTVRGAMPSYAIMGVVNVTPDSFSDGGLFLDADAAVEHGHRLAAEGAAILDIGGESTRPGSEPVAEDEELRRVLPATLAVSIAEREPMAIGRINGRLYLIDREGRVVANFNSKTRPDDPALVAQLERLLSAPAPKGKG